MCEKGCLEAVLDAHLHLMKTHQQIQRREVLAFHEKWPNLIDPWQMKRIVLCFTFRPGSRRTCASCRLSWTPALFWRRTGKRLVQLGKSRHFPKPFDLLLQVLAPSEGNWAKSVLEGSRISRLNRVCDPWRSVEINRSCRECVDIFPDYID